MTLTDSSDTEGKRRNLRHFFAGRNSSDLQSHQSLVFAAFRRQQRAWEGAKLQWQFCRLHPYGLLWLQGVYSQLRHSETLFKGHKKTLRIATEKKQMVAALA